MPRIVGFGDRQGLESGPLLSTFVPPLVRDALGEHRMALGGAVGDPPNGAVFDPFGGYRPLFVMMAEYTALAWVAVLLVPSGTGEIDTGPSSHP